MKTIETEVAIVGSGGAGLRAAIEVHDNGTKPLVISKAMHRKPHTVMAEGGIASALGNVDPKDNWQTHAYDTLEEGVFISSRKMAELLGKESKDRLLELESWGAIFDRTEDGKIMQRAFGAHTHNRVCHIGDRTGLEIIQTLADQVRKRNIPYLEEVQVTNILVVDSMVNGLTAIDLRTGEFLVIHTKAVIFATGGYARIYKRSTNPWECTGDGYAIAYYNGIELKDMEMIQFHPTGMVWPESAEGILVTESVRGDGGLLFNAKNERFMPKYDTKRAELSARDIVARAIYSEITSGRGTEHDGVWLDISHKPADYINLKLPKMVQQFKDFANVDITKERMEVAPTAHYTMGGIKVLAETTETSIKGVFAAGEVASGVHGANRLGGNSLADILVFGRRAGIYAAEYVKSAKIIPIDQNQTEKELQRLKKPFEKNNGESAQKLSMEIQELMWKYVGIVRNKENLEIAVKEIESIKDKLPEIAVKGTMKFNHEFLDFINLHNMVVCAEATTRAALMREESRGAHFRSDFKEIDDKNWFANIACSFDNGKMKLEKQSIATGKEKFT